MAVFAVDRSQIIMKKFMFASGLRQESALNFAAFQRRFVDAHVRSHEHFRFFRVA